MERAIDFPLDHHAKFSADIEELKKMQRRQSENSDKLRADVRARTGNVEARRVEMGANRIDLREAIANEGTRHLAEQAT